MLWLIMLPGIAEYDGLCVALLNRQGFIVHYVLHPYGQRVELRLLVGVSLNKELGISNCCDQLVKRLKRRFCYC